MGTKQIETATVIGTVTSVTGNASVVITSGYVTGSPLTVAVAVVLNDTADLVAGKIRAALALTEAVTAAFGVSGATADVILTSHIERANDTSLNIAIDNGTCTGLTAAPTSTNTQAGVGITNGYAALANFKTRFGVQGTDAPRDAEIESIIQGVSRMIDNYCKRRFFITAADETKTYTPEGGSIIFTDDINSITSLKTDEDGDSTYENTWATTDYMTFPLNRTADIDPITRIRIAQNGNYIFPGAYSSVQIIGKFGYCTLANVPDPIKEACYLQSMRLFMRQKAPFGVVGAGEMGQLSAISSLDPDVKILLEPYRRLA